MIQGNKIAGANPTRGRVENDYYATSPESIKSLLKVEKIIYPALEPACGAGHISKFLDEEKTDSSDLIYRGYGKGGIDFLLPESYHCDYFKEYYNTIITNPPFNLFQEFVEKARAIIGRPNGKVIMFGKLQALEGQKRATYLEKSSLKTVYVFKKRQQPLRNGSEIDPITGEKWASSTMAFAWFVFGRGYTEKPQIEWI